MALLIVLVISPKSFGADANQSPSRDSESASLRTTIWDRPIGDEGATYSDVTLLRGAEGLEETAVLPLPAPLLTGVGLLVVFAIRARNSRH